MKSAGQHLSAWTTALHLVKVVVAPTGDVAMLLPTAMVRTTLALA